MKVSIRIDVLHCYAEALSCDIVSLSNFLKMRKIADGEKHPEKSLDTQKQPDKAAVRSKSRVASNLPFGHVGYLVALQGM